MDAAEPSSFRVPKHARARQNDETALRVHHHARDRLCGPRSYNQDESPTQDTACECQKSPNMLVFVSPIVSLRRAPAQCPAIRALSQTVYTGWHSENMFPPVSSVVISHFEPKVKNSRLSQNCRAGRRNIEMANTTRV